MGARLALMRLHSAHNVEVPVTDPWASVTSVDHAIIDVVDVVCTHLPVLTQFLLLLMLYCRDP